MEFQSMGFSNAIRQHLTRLVAKKIPESGV